MSTSSLIMLAIAGLLTAFIAYGRKNYTAGAALLILEFLLVMAIFMRVL